MTFKKFNQSVSFFLLSIFALAAGSGCNKSKSSEVGVDSPTAATPATVDVGEVKTIVVANRETAKDCEDDIRKSGGKVLYRNALGLLFTDVDLEKLNLGCGAQATRNEKFSAPQMPPLATGDAKPLDLSTLLSLIPSEEIGAQTFIKNNPKFDGRGVVIAVLDTGVELDHPLLAKTSDGKDKILDFQDLSGEGRVTLAPVVIADNAFKAPTSNTSYTTKDVVGQNFHFGVFKGSSLSYAADLAAKDKFVDVGVLVYQVNGTWHGRIDTNDNHSFTDDTDLSDFKTSRKFTKLGEGKSLTASLTVSTDGKSASIAFDDGGHGTHVSGIATGYDAKGLQGVAPGAQVVVGKLGDNRLSGGSTTTASMMLAIDFAVKSKAQIVNMSFGIRSGSNVGRSAIDQYVDKVAGEKGIIFSISAGNEGPGLLTVGTPAGASLAITNGAYISRKTGVTNYRWPNFEQDTIWYFSSVGPRLDGGWKPTLLAPGSALSSVPLWSGTWNNAQGTSMASPQATGGLALLVSAALQLGLPSDRVSITQAVYESAVPVKGLSLIEQGHGLMNVPQALQSLQKYKALPVLEYAVSVNSPTAPSGRGTGIYVRSSELPENIFRISVKPNFASGTTAVVQTTISELLLVPSAPWISVPKELTMTGAPTNFTATLNPSIHKTPGLHSEKITAIEKVSGRPAFEIPVTVVTPNRFTDHAFTASPKLRVGETIRYFLDVPAGATAIQVDLISDKLPVWGQLLDQEGRKLLTLRDSETSAPQVPLLGSKTISKPGVYELDVVVPPGNQAAPKVQITVRLYSLSLAKGSAEGKNSFDVVIQNNYEAIKVVPQVEIRSLQRTKLYSVTGSVEKIEVPLTKDDRKTYSKIGFNVVTSKKFYDLMTDYPIRIFDAKEAVLISTALELDTTVEVADFEKAADGNLRVEVQGAFAIKAPEKWAFTFTETRYLSDVKGSKSTDRLLMEPGQTRSIPIDFSGARLPTAEGFQTCLTVSLKAPVTDRLIQELPICLE